MSKNTSQPNPPAARSITLVVHIPIPVIAALVPVLVVLLIITTLSALGTFDARSVFAQDDVREVSQDVAAFTSAGTLNFQGELRDQSSGTPLADGDYKMRFAIYDSDVDGTKFWPAPSPDFEEHTAISLTDGLFNVSLGSNISIPGSVFDDGGNRYLQIWVCPTAGTGCTDFEDLGRLPISSVGYAKSFIPGASISGTGMVLGLSSSTTDGSVLTINASASNGNAAGVYASSSGPSGAGLSGYNASSGYGVYGSSASGTGVYGYAAASSGTFFGVHGKNNSASGAGVYGESNNSDGVGVHGENSFGYGTGVRGDSAGGAGVYGTSLTGSGLYGTSPVIGTMGIATGPTGTNYGVFGQNNSQGGSGVYGESSHSEGVGVYGSSTNGTGVYGTSTVSGTVGVATDPSGLSYGVYGQNASPIGAGVYGTSTHPNGYGVYSDGNLYVDGDMHIEGGVTWKPLTGTISIPAAAFHPMDNSMDYYNDGYILWYKGSGVIEDMKAFFAPVYLPHQAQLKDLSVRVCAGTPLIAGKFEIRLLSYDTNAGYNAGPHEIDAIISSVIYEDTCVTYSTNTFTPDIVDNDNYAYYVGVWMVGTYTGEIPYVSLHNVIIEYEFSRPY